MMLQILGQKHFFKKYNDQVESEPIVKKALKQDCRDLAQPPSNG